MRHAFEIMKRAQALMEKKENDYTNGIDYHSNFRYSAYIAEPFPEKYKPYALLVGVKLARLSALLQPGRVVKNESIEDSFLDLINYCTLMAERFKLES